MTTHVLAGDIGGTNSRLALYQTGADGLTLVRGATFPSRDHAGLEEVIARFLAEASAPPVAAAAFGVAGPVVDDAVVATNLPWHIRSAALRARLGTPLVRLLNDLEATAHGALALAPEKLLALNAGVARPGNRAVIAAGTGLGQALLFWDGARHVPVATEGGHADFAPRDEVEHDLLRWLERKYDGHVSYERAVSGHGLANIFAFLDEHCRMPVADETRRRLQHEDPAAVIGELGVAGACGTAVAAVERFVSIYGAQAGNLALTVMATSGVYVGGGIVNKLLSAMTGGAFMRAFVAKGRYERLVREIPVWIIREPNAGLYGAAHVAAALLHARA
ncbi:MAG: glucokinase [Deltaproteobacteria bacterium]|nr:glucokinase [Deltaproteobacteria bacterium]